MWADAKNIDAKEFSSFVEKALAQLSPSCQRSQLAMDSEQYANFANLLSLKLDIYQKILANNKVKVSYDEETEKSVSPCDLKKTVDFRKDMLDPLLMNMVKNSKVGSRYMYSYLFNVYWKY
uniref:Uncharacterized protein n=1 Tax=Euplotes harpa TaxID=151035 RepID=A0A7S3J1P8_9SPIT|mmetsp:Transcript_14771/g.17090  ORF Transcript_14771/g.17090 Transcript_14771/m.17090 type:complete len:121 (+) Transcript_14771:1287-1649(+)